MNKSDRGSGRLLLPPLFIIVSLILLFIAQPLSALTLRYGFGFEIGSLRSELPDHFTRQGELRDQLRYNGANHNQVERPFLFSIAPSHHSERNESTTPWSLYLGADHKLAGHHKVHLQFRSRQLSSPSIPYSLLANEILELTPGQHLLLPRLGGGEMQGLRQSDQEAELGFTLPLHPELLLRGDRQEVGVELAVGRIDLSFGLRHESMSASYNSFYSPFEFYSLTSAQADAISGDTTMARFSQLLIGGRNLNSDSITWGSGKPRRESTLFVTIGSRIVLGE